MRSTSHFTEQALQKPHKINPENNDNPWAYSSVRARFSLGSSCKHSAAAMSSLALLSSSRRQEKWETTRLLYVWLILLLLHITAVHEPKNVISQHYLPDNHESTRGALCIELGLFITTAQCYPQYLLRHGNGRTGETKMNKSTESRAGTSAVKNKTKPSSGFS